MGNQYDSTVNSYSRYIEPAMIITFLSALVYLIGYLYVLIYFSKFRIFKYLVPSVDFILTWGLLPIYISIVALGFFVLIYVIVPKESRIAIYIGNLPALISGVLFITTYFEALEGIPYGFIFVIFGIFGLLWYIILIVFGRAFFSKYWQSSDWRKVFVFVFLSIMTLLFSLNFGSYAANSLLTGNSVTTIDLKLKNNNGFNFQNESYILILHYDEKYFITKHENSPLKDPIVFIIPDDQVEYATVYCGLCGTNLTPFN